MPIKIWTVQPGDTSPNPEKRSRPVVDAVWAYPAPGAKLLGERTTTGLQGTCSRECAKGLGEAPWAEYRPRRFAAMVDASPPWRRDWTRKPRDGPVRAASIGRA